MKTTNRWLKLEKLIERYTLSIAYQPLPGEPDPVTIPFKKRKGIRSVIVPPSSGTNPSKLATRLKEQHGWRRAYILVPGRRFDLTGVRHGRGKGWFDRFLAKLPTHWIRIGVTSVQQISLQSLDRNYWDEPMDWIVWHDGKKWWAVETLARKKT